MSARRTAGTCWLLGALALAVQICTPLVLAGQAAEQAADKSLATYFADLLDEAEVPGGVLALSHGDGRVEIHAAGARELDSTRPIREGDCFYIGSLTKTYVATIVLQLVEEGLIDLNAPLATYLPDVPRADRIRIRHLLNHTAGMEDAYIHLYYLPLDEMLEAFSRPWNKVDLVELGTSLPPRFEPGTDYYYAGTHYDVLARVIERVTRGSLESQLRKRIYEPLGLESTWMALGAGAPPDCLVTGHLAPTEFWEHSDVLYPELAASTNIDEPMKAWAAGGMGSTAEEMLRFSRALFDGDLLSPQSLRAMRTFLDPRDVTKLSTEPTGFGYGLGLIHMPRQGHRRIGHGGMYSGYTVGLWNIPEHRVHVALLLNRGLFFGEREMLDQLVQAISQRTAER